VTNVTQAPNRVVMFYNQRGTAEQHQGGQNAVIGTGLSCRRFAANAVRLQLHALAYNLANFLRTPALPEVVEQWSMTALRDRLVKIGRTDEIVGKRLIRRLRSATNGRSRAAIWEIQVQMNDADTPTPPSRARQGGNNNKLGD
jgi:hypothetical protein